MDEEQHWYAIMTFNRDTLRIRELALREGIDCFVPMMYVIERDPRDTRVAPHEAFRPVVQNYVFVRVPRSRLYANPQQAGKVWPVLRLGYDADTPAADRIDCHIIHHQDSMEPSVIPDKSIADCRRLSDPEFSDSVFITLDDRATREQTTGRRIRMTRGRFKGMEGTLAYGRNHTRIFVLTLGNISYKMNIRPWMFEFI